MDFTKKGGANSSRSVAALRCAAALVELGDEKSAEAKLLEALSYDPLNSEALLLLADMYMEEGLYSRARPLLEQALAVNPNEADAIWNLASCHVAEGQDDEAMALMEKFMALGQANTRQKILTAQVLYRKGSLNNDRSVFAKVAVILEGILASNADNYEANSFMGELCFAMAQYVRSAGYYEKALSLRPNGPESGYIRNNLGAALRMAGRLGDAAEVLEEAARMLPDNGIVRHNLESSQWARNMRRSQLN